MHRLLLVTLAAGIAVGCAAPLHQASKNAPAPAAGVAGPRPVVTTAGRPTVGVAFGGGSARGLAHVGVVRWMLEHHIPIDVAAGTSMGGLIGGAFASGMDAADLQALIASMNWDQLFGASTFAYKNVRRKADARAYPSRLEFGLRGGIVAPTSLNSGEYVELLLNRIAAPYADVDDFNDLPTPFRTVAVDLLSAQPVVIGHGSLADAMRATMSLPLIFPPVDRDGRVLVDGGAMNNVPADVVKAMGADHVVAINVGDLSNPDSLNYTLLGLAGATLDAMMRASTLKALGSADIVINVPLHDYGSLDWRRATELADEGYRAAEAMRDKLLPLAVGDAEFEAWRNARQGRRRTQLPVPAFVTLEGFASSDARQLKTAMARHVGVPIDIAAVDRDLEVLSGLDRYETITWRITRSEAGAYGLLVRGRVKTYAPPFMMLGLNLENTTSSDFQITATARYLAYDILRSGSELRIDGTVGSNPSVATELYRPLGATPLFVAPYANVGKSAINFIDDDSVVARYGITRTRAGFNIGANLGAKSDVRIGAYVGRVTARIKIGNPDLPELQGKETGSEIVWRIDTQDSPVVPTVGLFSQVRLSHEFDAPDRQIPGIGSEASSPVTQLAGSASNFWSAGARGRLFVYGAVGTSFDTQPPATSLFLLGSPFRLGAYALGEIRGAHSYVATGGYLHQVARLPDFLGGPVFVGGWLENGDAFDKWSLATWRTNASVGLIMDTIVGPVIVAGSSGFDGRWRTYLGIGRIFR